jgi:hypothetical protein
MRNFLGTTTILAFIVATPAPAQTTSGNSRSTDAMRAAFVRNFTDAEVEVLKFFQAGFPLSSRYNKPRTYGLSATYSW